ncbi:MAG TPA: hypothetical protein VGB38_08490 [bacterium]
MNRIAFFFLVLLFAPIAFGADLIILKNGQEYRGQVTKIVDNKTFVIKTTEGNVIGIPKANIAKIIRDNKVLDFIAGESYYLEKKRPFLPFIVLSAATGAYSVKKFQDSQEHRKQANDAKLGEDVQNMKDQSNKDIAEGVVSGLFCLGSLYVAFKPIEVKVPIGRLSISTVPNGVMLSLKF